MAFKINNDGSVIYPLHSTCYEGYLSDIDGLADYEILVAVMHLTSGQNPPEALPLICSLRLLDDSLRRSTKHKFTNFK